MNLTATVASCATATRSCASFEQKDATADEQLLNEINSGVICAPASRLRTWLDNLRADNDQQEYYLTDIIAMAVADGVAVRGIKPTMRMK